MFSLFLVWKQNPSLKYLYGQRILFFISQDLNTSVTMMWNRDQGGADKSITNEQNSLGQVIINLSKLAGYDGVDILQKFDLSPIKVFHYPTIMISIHLN